MCSSDLANANGKYPFVAKDGWNWGAGGFAVGSSEITYVKSLIVDRNIFATVDAGLADYTGTADAIIIKKNGYLTLSDTNPHVGAIKGLDASTSYVELAGSSTDWSGYSTDMNNIGSIEKVILDNGWYDSDGDNLKDKRRPARLADTSKFNSVEFVNDVTVNGTTFANVKFNALNIPVSKDNQTYSFSNVNFAGTVTVTGNYSTTVASYTKTWQWVVDGTGSGYWSEITSAAPLKAYNANEDVQEFTSNNVKPTEGSATLGGNTPGAVTSKVIKITYNDNKKLNPENTVISLTSDCKIKDVALGATNINNTFGNKTIDQIWYTVAVDGVAYNWRKESGTGALYLLIKP